ncbi:hypothetical protein ACFQ2B_08350 [Streptomyces stramineus]
MPGHRVERLHLAPVPLPARASSRTPRRARAAAPSASSSGSAPGAGVKSPGSARDSPAVSVPPRAIHAASPPSRTRTSPWPAQRSIHQARAAPQPLSPS